MRRLVKGEADGMGKGSVTPNQLSVTPANAGVFRTAGVYPGPRSGAGMTRNECGYGEVYLISNGRLIQRARKTTNGLIRKINHNGHKGHNGCGYNRNRCGLRVRYGERLLKTPAFAGGTIKKYDEQTEQTCHRQNPANELIAASKP